MAEIDFMGQFNALGGMQQTILYVAIAGLGLLFLCLILMVIVNRGTRFGYKIDLKGRSSGLFKKLPF